MPIAPARRPIASRQAAGELGFFVDAVPADAGGMLEGSYSHATRALRGFELGRGCAALAALLESNVEPALAVGAWGSAAAKQALFGSLAGRRPRDVRRTTSRGTLEVTDEGDDVRITGKLGPAPALAAASHVLVATGGVLAARRDRRHARATRSRRRAGAPRAGRPRQLEAHRVPADFVLARDPARSPRCSRGRARSLAARAAGVATAAMEHAEALRARSASSSASRSARSSR